MLTVADVVRAIEALYPPQAADDWDRVGLIAGDPAAPVRRLHLAVDPTLAVVQEALAAGADLLFTHHPLMLRGVSSVATTTPIGATVTAAIRGQLAMYAAHTNADKADTGVADALAQACGLETSTPLVPEGFGPGGSVVGTGRVGELPAPMTLRDFVEALARQLPATAGGTRVAGDPDALVRRVAVLGGSGDRYIDIARSAGADVYVTADLKHHPALDAREASAGGTPYLVDCGHWASEWLWLAHAQRALRATLDPMPIHVSTLRTDPWTFVVGANATGGTS